MQIHAFEHYCEPNQFLTCSAAPLFDPESIMTGILNVTGDCRMANAHTMGMVVAAAASVESQLRLQRRSMFLPGTPTNQRRRCVIGR